MPLNKLPRLREPEKRDFVHEVKDKVLEFCKENSKLVYQEDVKQVESFQFLLERCIITKRKNVKDSTNMLIAMLKWRKELRLRELADYNFPVEYHMCGAIFLYEPDVHGNKTLYVRTQVLRNIPELRSSFKEFLAYKIYQIDESTNGSSWSVIFDLTNTGWNNYDLDLMVHFLTLLREYFPMNLDYVLAINFPWVLSAAWTLAKRLIPPERRDAVFFISHNEVFKYIVKENAPDFLGGTCTREHQTKPENCQTVVDYLHTIEPEVPKKRLREIVNSFSEIVGDEEHVSYMYSQLELTARK